MGEALDLYLPLQLPLPVNLIILFEIAQNCILIEILELWQQERCPILLQQLETDFLAHVCPPSHVFGDSGEVGNAGVGGQHCRIDFEYLEEEDGGGQF